MWRDVSDTDLSVALKLHLASVQMRVWQNHGAKGYEEIKIEK